MADLTTLQAQLAEAQTAYHNLTIGGAARVFVDQNGERVEYVAANASNLLAYIMRLQQAIACGGSDPFPRPRAIGICF